MFYIIISIPLDEICDDRGNRADHHAFDNEGSGDERARRAHISHDGYFMTPCVYRKLYRIHDDKDRDDNEDNKEPYEDKKYTGAEALQRGGEIETVVHLFDPFHMIKGVIKVHDLGNILVGYDKLIGEGVVFVGHIIVSVRFFARLCFHLLESLCLCDMGHAFHIVKRGDLFSEGFDSLLVKVAVCEYDDLIKVAEGFQIDVYIEDEERERADDHKTAHQHGDGGEGHDAVAHYPLKCLRKRIFYAESSHLNIPPTRSSAILPSLSITTRCL